MKPTTKIENNFKYILREFEPNLNYSEPWIDLGDSRKTLKRYPFKIPQKHKIKYPFIVYLIFKDILDFPILPRFEKVAWEIPILFKGKEFVLAHRKFGFDISAFKESKELQDLAVEAIEKINIATPLVETVINPKIQEQVRLGNITLESKYTSIRSRYIFFRKKLENKNNHDLIELKSKITNFNWSNFKTSEEAEKSYNEIQRLRNSNSYYLYAMIDSYFSLLEHISVLLIPFLSHIRISELDFEKFIGQNWKKKLQFILENKVNPGVNRKIEILEEIKENIRNPVSHGYFYKNRKSFYVHMEGLGAIPFTLTKSKTKYKFSDFSPDFMPIKTICKHFDDFDEFLETQKTKFGMRYIKRDLPVAFDKSSATKYRKRMRTDKSTKKYIEETIMELENAINMDW